MNNKFLDAYLKAHQRLEEKLNDAFLDLIVFGTARLVLTWDSDDPADPIKAEVIKPNLTNECCNDEPNN